jgi:YHS domain-containing protein
MAIDPICKMKVDPGTAAAKSEYKGKTYYSCAPGCKATFDKDPAKYAQEAEGESGSHAQHHHRH